MKDFILGYDARCLDEPRGTSYLGGKDGWKLPMPRIARPLTQNQVRSLPPGMYADGGATGLYLAVGPNSRSWIFRYQLGERRREMGIGSIRLYDLQRARDTAIDFGRGLREGIDPLEQRRQRKAAQKPTLRVTFGDIALAYTDAMKAGWRPGTEKAWQQSMRLHVFPAIGKLPVADVDTAAVVKALTPIWEKNANTGSTIRSRIELVLGMATSKGLRQGDNPARWNGHLEFHLASPSKAATVMHFEALPYVELPDFLSQLRTIGNSKSDAIEFTILTCARIGEVLGAIWREIDLPGRVWTIPDCRMKGRKEHRVPLSDAALKVLERQKRRNDTDFIFVGDKGKPMVGALIGQVLRKVHDTVTIHGFRSTFRDWSAETGKDRDLAEMALSHVVGSHVERSYRRSDLIEKRRELATAWAQHCDG
jgi:integrase